MNQAPPYFDDPQLKLTLRRAIGAIAAGEPLRATVVDLMRRETAPSRPRPMRISRRGMLRTAIAAGVVLAGGAGGGYLWRRHHLAAEEAEYLAANLPLFRTLIAAEQSPPPAPQALPLDDRAALRAALSAKLARPVPVPDWRAKGWRLAAAAVAPVGPHAAAQLRYENGGRSILFVSLPAAAYTAEDGEPPEPYAYAVDGHALAGFVRDGGLHCAVGDSHVTPQELADLKVD